MANKKKTTREVGEYKIKINNALLKSPEIRNLLTDGVGDKINKESIISFKEHVMSHLFIDDTIKDKSTYIFYDVVVPGFRTHTKNIHIIVYAICHRDILENINIDNTSYCGNRADVLSQIIENTLLDESIVNEFGIGNLELIDLDIYNSTTFYGRIMTFEVYNFR